MHYLFTPFCAANQPIAGIDHEGYTFTPFCAEQVSEAEPAVFGYRMSIISSSLVTQPLIISLIFSKRSVDVVLHSILVIRKEVG